MKTILLWGLLLSISVALFSFLASSWPDGLEKVAGDKGFIEKGEVVLFNAPIPDYCVPGLKSENFATVLAGIIGVLAVSVLTYLVAKLAVKR